MSVQNSEGWKGTPRTQRRRHRRREEPGAAKTHTTALRGTVTWALRFNCARALGF